MPNNRTVYLHIDTEVAQQQYALRTSLNVNSYSKVLLPPSGITIEILAEVIRSCHIEVQELPICNQLKQRSIDVSLETVKYVFDFYQVKKKQI